MDEQELLVIEQWAQAAKDHGGCGMTCSGVDDLLAMVAEVKRLRAELAGYVGGYDPRERMPEPGVKVLVQSKSGGLDSASIRVWADTGEQMWQGRGWSAPIGYARRWYPAGGE